MNQKPDSCKGCPLYLKGSGFAKPIGPKNADILVLGEALGFYEAEEGEPFVGPSGRWLNKQLQRVGLDREQVRITNMVSCQPPNDWLEGAPWESEAINHCYQNHLKPVLEEGHKAVITLGSVATRNLLGLSKHKHKQQDWHSIPVRDRQNRFWVIPAFHPAYILRGNHKLTGVNLFAFKNAIEAAKNGHEKKLTILRCDPSVEWFAKWVDDFLALEDPTILAVDIETVKKLEGSDESELDIDNAQIVRINFSCNEEEGITVPWDERYIPHIRRLLSHGRSIKAFWNIRYDYPILLRHGMAVCGMALDFMWGWHILQSSLPRGLGFVAPFYSDFGAWKHLSEQSPAEYGAIDGVQTKRIAEGIRRDLIKNQQWEVFLRHVNELDNKVLWPAEEIGLYVNPEELALLKKDMEAKQAEIYDKIQELVPEDLMLLSPPHGLKRIPKDDLDQIICKQVEADVLRCFTCGEIEVTERHKCKDKTLKASVEEVPIVVKRYFRREKFNPGSPKQILDYMKLKGHKPGSAKYTEGASTSEDTLKRLAKKDPFYQLILDYRAVSKVVSTYVEGMGGKIGTDGRVHAEFTYIPSTMRLSCRNPNLTNVIGDKDEDKINRGFRDCVQAADGYILAEVDYSAIEAVQFGWFCQDPTLIRLATLGIHGYVVAALHGDKIDLDQSDDVLAAIFKTYKSKYPADYDRAKRTVYGTFYGMSAIGLALTYPALFNRQSAAKFQGILYSLFPSIVKFQEQVQLRAARQGYLGGPDHPFRYKHWFWNVYTWNPRKRAWELGDDAKKAVAYYPQSTAAGIIKESALRLMEDPEFATCYKGKTPIRALIHDSILVELPDPGYEKYLRKMKQVMTRPILEQPMNPDWNMGTHLKIGVAIKVGKSWADMKEIKI